MYNNNITGIDQSPSNYYIFSTLQQHRLESSLNVRPHIETVRQLLTKRLIS
ncbi:hypothetical protein LINGRAHAP2_LOCUS35887, partial [Linum grandiflorum]